MDEVKTRRGSQRRRTSKRIAVNCTPEHYDAIAKLAEGHGQSPLSPRPQGPAGHAPAPHPPLARRRRPDAAVLLEPRPRP
jgi:hypothetical protein